MNATEMTSDGVCKSPFYCSSMLQQGCLNKISSLKLIIRCLKYICSYTILESLVLRLAVLINMKTWRYFLFDYLVLKNFLLLKSLFKIDSFSF